MNRVAITAAFMGLVLTSLLTLAADERSAESEQRIEEVRSRLALTDEQFGQMAPALEESMAAQQSILASYGIDLQNRSGSSKRLRPREAMALRRELEAVRADTQKVVDRILTDEQLEEFRQLQEERSAEMRERIRGAR